jgi:hypothetical protein
MTEVGVEGVSALFVFVIEQSFANRVTVEAPCIIVEHRIGSALHSDRLTLLTAANAGPTWSLLA